MSIRLSAILLLAFLLHTQIAPAQTDWQQADARARATPASAEKSVSALAEYLCPDNFSDAEKSRAIYIWMAENIAYDAKSYFEGKKALIAPNEVLHARKSVCQGYCALYKAIADEATIPCMVIGGYAKGYNYQTGKLESNHAWLALNIASKWKLTDPTWGAGYLDEYGKFVKRTEEKFFLANPREFILEHLPLDPAWQLLPCTLSVKDYQRDTSEVRQIVAKMKPCNLGPDSLDYIYNLDTETQNLHTARKAYAFNPANPETMGFAYLNYAVNKRTEKLQKIPKTNMEAILQVEEQSLAMQKEARKYFKLSKSESAARALIITEQNIASAEKYIAYLKQR